MTKIKEGFKITMTFEKLLAVLGIFGIVYSAGSKLWADKTEVEILKNDVTYIKQDVGETKEAVKYLEQIFRDYDKTLK